MRRRRTVVIVGVMLLSVGAAWAFIGTVPNPFDLPKPDADVEIVDSGTAEAREAGEMRDWVDPLDPFVIPKPADDKPGLPGWVDPFQIPVDLTPKPHLPPGELPGWVDLDSPGFKLPPDASAAERDAIRERRLALFTRDSPFPANPPGDVGVFRFDLKIEQFLDSSRAKGVFVQYVNSRDGSIALLEPERVIESLGGRPIPGVVLDLVLLRPGGNALVCGSQAELGKVCVNAGGDMSVGDGLLLDYTGAMSWFNSIASTAQTLPATPAGVRPSDYERPLRGVLPAGGHMSVWHDPVASRVHTQVPWLGLGAGLFKDYRARVNRVARVMVAEGADVNGGDVGFRLLGIQPADRSIDTQAYRLVTAFSSAGLEEAHEIGTYIMEERMQQAREIDAALRACTPGEAGRACRTKHRARMQALEQENADQILDWARRHGLPTD